MGVLSTLGRLFPGFNPAARTAVTAVQPTTPTRDDDRPRRSYGEKVPAGYGIGTNITFLPYVDSATADTAAIRDAMRQMLRDPWVKAAWTSQVFAVASQDHAVTPHDKKDANAILQAEFTRHWIEELPGGMSGLAMTIAMPLGPDGISVVEPVNAPPAASGRWAGKVMPSKCVARDVNHIRLIGDRFRNITTVKATREPTQPEYPAGDFVITQYMPVFGEPFGTAAFRASYSAYWMLDTIRKLRALHHEKRTKGRIVGTYDADSPDEKDQLEAALRQLSASDFAVVPEGVKIEAIAMTTANETDYKSFEQDKQTEIVTGIALASLQILQGNVTDARGDTGVQQETSQLGTWYLQRLVEEAVKQLVKLYIDLNFPSPAGYPKVTLGQVKQSEAKAFLDTIEQAQRLGFDDIDRRKVAEFASLPLATDDADKLKPKPPGGGADPFGGMFGGGGPPPAPPSPGAPPEPMLGDPATFSEQPYRSFAWTAAKTRTGGTKAVGTGRDTGRTLYGKAAAAALAAGGHKADHEGGKEYDSHRDRRAALESRRKRANELTQKLVSYNATPEEHKELVEHLPSLTRKQLSSVRERLMARFGGDKTLAGRVEKLKAHIAERATLPTGDTRPEDGRAVALEKRGEKGGADEQGQRGQKEADIGDTQSKTSRNAGPDGGVPGGQSGKPAPAEEVKEPWQVTGADYHAAQKAKFAKQYNLTPEQADKKYSTATNGNRRKDAILAAAAAGKRIPDAVLDEDPGLRDRITHDYPQTHADYVPPEVRAKIAASPTMNIVPVGQFERSKPIWNPPAAVEKPQEIHLQTRSEYTRPEEDGYGLSPRERKSYEIALSQRHYDAVRAALKSGKSVPPEVLADYPDLKPKAPAPTPAADDLVSVVPARPAPASEPGEKTGAEPRYDGHAAIDAVYKKQVSAKAISDAAKTPEEHADADAAFRSVASDWQAMADHYSDQKSGLDYSPELAGDYSRKAAEYNRMAGWHQQRAKSPAPPAATAADTAKDDAVKNLTDQILAADRRKGPKSKYKGPSARGLAEEEARRQLGIGKPKRSDAETLAALVADYPDLKPKAPTPTPAADDLVSVAPARPAPASEPGERIPPAGVKAPKATPATMSPPPAETPPMIPPPPPAPPASPEPGGDKWGHLAPDEADFIRKHMAKPMDGYEGRPAASMAYILKESRDPAAYDREQRIADAVRKEGMDYPMTKREIFAAGAAAKKIVSENGIPLDVDTDHARRAVNLRYRNPATGNGGVEPIAEPTEAGVKKAAAALLKRMKAADANTRKFMRIQREEDNS